MPLVMRFGLDGSITCWRCFWRDPRLAVLRSTTLFWYSAVCPMSLLDTMSMPSLLKGTPDHNLALLHDKLG